MEEPRPAATVPFSSQMPAEGTCKDSKNSRQKPLLAETDARSVPGQKRSYARTVQQPSAAHFQHDPLRAAKKTFLEGEIRRIGTDCNYKGEPGIIYSTEETEFLASRLKFSLVGKFSHGLPNLNFLRNRIVKLGLKGSVNVGRLNFKHVLIRLNNEEDFSRLWLRGEWTFDNFHMRVFKWSPDFDPHTESPIAPVWIKLPGLPVHLFEKNALLPLPLKLENLLEWMNQPLICLDLT
ncbi:UNVERIFIED_CONTAM: hypothetical protein Sradi_6943400 [Sesamum radiatum]|uniref:DUF4283 domain-containing protein n=1 Tax=Sesamum radiatum TaxID=300843 RepID=A0AAW2JHC1_SESRA